MANTCFVSIGGGAIWEGIFATPAGVRLTHKQLRQDPVLIEFGHLRIDAARHVRRLVDEVALDAMVDAVLPVRTHLFVERAELTAPPRQSPRRYRSAR